MHNARKLREFFESVSECRAEKNFVSLKFAVAYLPNRLKIHPGKCILRFFIQNENRIIVTAKLVALSAGTDTTNFLDFCRFHFETNAKYVSEFILQLDHQSSSPWKASLIGDELQSGSCNM